MTLEIRTELTIERSKRLLGNFALEAAEIRFNRREKRSAFLEDHIHLERGISMERQRPAAGSELKSQVPGMIKNCDIRSIAHSFVVPMQKKRLYLKQWIAFPDACVHTS